MTIAMPAFLTAIAVMAVVAVWRYPRPLVAVAGAGSLVLATGALAVADFLIFGIREFGMARNGPPMLLALLVGYGFLCALLLWRPHRAWAAVIAFGATVTAAAGVDAFVIEPRQLEVTHTVIASAEARHPIRIALIADIQFDEFGDYETDALRATMAEHPDLILFAGDYVQARPADVETQREAFRAAMTETALAAPLGVFAVEGHAENAGWTSMFEDFGVRPVRGQEDVVVGDLTLTLLDLASSEDASFSADPADGLHIVLGHSPDYALGDVRADVLLAGHTHGGQVSIPFFGPPLTMAEVPRAWASGHTELSSDRHLYVSRGVGMERGNAPRVRFLTRPELAIIDIVPAGSD